MNLIGYIIVDYQLIVYSKIVACVIVYMTQSFKLESVHMAQMAHHVWTWWNIMKHSFSTRYLTFFLLCNETTSKFILKQLLDYSPSFSTSDSRLGCTVVDYLLVENSGSYPNKVVKQSLRNFQRAVIYYQGKRFIF